MVIKSRKSNLIFSWILRERFRQERLYPSDNYTLEDWLIILFEESGDVAQTYHHRPGDTRELQDQLLHVAAIAVAMLEQLPDTEPPCIGHAHLAWETSEPVS